MLNKIIDVLGFALITFVIGFAVYFYATELIKIISKILMIPLDKCR